MANKNRVLWKEGLFIRPHHFQQQDRYYESMISNVLTSGNGLFFGFRSIRIDEKHLAYGKFALENAVGAMPDGTVFSLPAIDSLPKPLTVNTQCIGRIVYLCLPITIEGSAEVSRENESKESIARGKSVLTDVKDTYSEQGDYAAIDVIQNQFVLKFDSDDLSSYSVLPIAKIRDVTADNSVVFDEDFYPAATAIAAIPRVHKMLTEVAGLMYERARIIAERISSPNQSGVADVTDFMMLQVLNCASPRFKHFSKLSNLHPERLYEALLTLCGEMSTFVAETRLAEIYPNYTHETPHECFIPIEKSLRVALGTVMEARAVPLPIEALDYGIHRAPITDRGLLDGATFILAVKASVPAEVIKSQFVHQTKITSIEKIKELVSLQLSGVPLIALPVAPRQLPYHAGFTYFELDAGSPAWNDMRDASGFGFHFAGNYADMELEFWSVKEDKS